MIISGFLSRDDFENIKKFQEGIGIEEEMTVKLNFSQREISRKDEVVIPIGIELSSVKRITFGWNLEDGHFGIVTAGKK